MLAARSAGCRLSRLASSQPLLACPAFSCAAGVDRRSMLEIECAAKIGLSGGPLYYRCVRAATEG